MLDATGGTFTEDTISDEALSRLAEAVGALMPRQLDEGGEVALDKCAQLHYSSTVLALNALNDEITRMSFHAQER